MQRFRPRLIWRLCLRLHLCLLRRCKSADNDRHVDNDDNIPQLTRPFYSTSTAGLPSRIPWMTRWKKDSSMITPHRHLQLAQRILQAPAYETICVAVHDEGDLLFSKQWPRLHILCIITGVDKVHPLISIMDATTWANPNTTTTRQFQPRELLHRLALWLVAVYREVVDCDICSFHIDNAYLR